MVILSHFSLWYQQPALLLEQEPVLVAVAAPHDININISGLWSLEPDTSQHDMFMNRHGMWCMFMRLLVINPNYVGTKTFIGCITLNISNVVERDES